MCCCCALVASRYQNARRRRSSSQAGGGGAQRQLTSEGEDAGRGASIWWWRFFSALQMGLTGTDGRPTVRPPQVNGQIQRGIPGNHFGFFLSHADLCQRLDMFTNTAACWYVRISITAQHQPRPQHHSIATTATRHRCSCVVCCCRYFLREF